MTKQTTQKIKGIAILVMIAHHFLTYDFGMNFFNIMDEIAITLRIIVAVYAVLSGYGYYFAKEKSVKYGLKKIWGLLQIYWIMLFTLFVPAALMGGWKLTVKSAVINLFALGPNLNWNAWYVYFFIFCMLVMPAVHKVFKYHPAINIILAVFVPYMIEVAIYVLVPNYYDIIILRTLFNCMLVFGIFLSGYLMAQYDVISRLNINWVFGLLSMIGALVLRTLFINIYTFGFNMDIIFAPVFVIGAAKFFGGLEVRWFKVFSVLGKYSTGMWFFHAVFFSTYICDWFQPIMKIVPWAPLMYVWLVILSLFGAIIYQKILEGIHSIPRLANRKS